MNLKSKFCVGCQSEMSVDEFYKNGQGLFKYCKTCSNSKSHWRAASLKERGLCISCGSSARQETNSKCVACWEVEKARTKEWRNSLMRDVIDFYGGRCACCGEARLEFLTLDHINNDGYLDRKLNGHRGGYMFYVKLLKSGKKRDDLQVLCYNCNNGKVRNDGICPHLTQRLDFTISMC